MPAGRPSPQTMCSCWRGRIRTCTTSWRRTWMAWRRIKRLRRGVVVGLVGRRARRRSKLFISWEASLFFFAFVSAYGTMWSEWSEKVRTNCNESSWSRLLIIGWWDRCTRCQRASPYAANHSFDHSLYDHLSLRRLCASNHVNATNLSISLAFGFWTAILIPNSLVFNHLYRGKLGAMAFQDSVYLFHPMRWQRLRLILYWMMVRIREAILKLESCRRELTWSGLSYQKRHIRSLHIDM